MERIGGGGAGRLRCGRRGPRTAGPQASGKGRRRVTGGEGPVAHTLCPPLRPNSPNAPPPPPEPQAAEQRIDESGVTPTARGDNTRQNRGDRDGQGVRGSSGEIRWSRPVETEVTGGGGGSATGMHWKEEKYPRPPGGAYVSAHAQPLSR